MVYYFESQPNPSGPKYVVYMGKDKVENESLLQYGFASDVWFHVDNLSSAHVYLRLPDGSTLDDIPADVLMDCAQLTKANSITGSKRDNVKVLYTLWPNLKKNGSMTMGEVGFRSEGQPHVLKVHVKSKDTAVLNRLNKTKQERNPDLELEKLEYEKELRRKYGEEHRLRQKEERETAKYYQQLAEQKNRGYSDLFDENALEGASNQNRNEDWEDDFM